MPVRYQSSTTNPLERRAAPRSIDLGSTSIPRSLLPISPPETERNTPSVATESRHPLSHSPVQPPFHPGAPEAFQVTPPTATPEQYQSAPAHYRRPSHVSYVQSSLRPRAAPAPSPARPSKWLVVVMPPSSLNSEPSLGHTLSTSPPGRFQSGILMPLFPTLYGQLAAITKEFSLPSTTGVCVYLHVKDGGLNMSPRISDESWQLLWGHYFIPDDSAPTYPAHQLPICGQIEFDVDIRKARWYESWVGGHARHPSLEAAIPPPVAQSLHKWYRDAQDQANAHDDAETQMDDGVSARGGRRIPRPLALTVREGSVRSMHRYQAVNARDTDAESTSRHVPANPKLSPVIQVDEPATAKNHLDTLVRNWRATTPRAPAMFDHDDRGPDTLDSPFEINPEDYQWSISSAGPPIHPLDTAWSDVSHSVHMGERTRGSVLLSPSICTSFGPDGRSTPALSNVSRYPSPDIGARLLEDAPLTPSTATSFGPPLSWPASPASVERIPSPDLADRAAFSPPDSPMTATSWGAPSHWPVSPFPEFRAHTPDLAHRGRFSPPPTPSTATSWGAPEHWPASPREYSRPATPGCMDRMLHDDEEIPLAGRPWQNVWPYTLHKKEEAVNLVWPYTLKVFQASSSSSAEVTAVPPPQKEAFKMVWPYIVSALQPKPEGFKFVWPYTLTALPPKHEAFQFVWPYTLDTLQAKPEGFKFVWPYTVNTLQPKPEGFKLVWPYTLTALSPKPEGFKFVWPYTLTALPPKHEGFKFVWPYTINTLQAKPSAVLPSAYPYLTIYPAVYPHVGASLYPAAAASRQDIPKSQSARLRGAGGGVSSYEYPELIVYPGKKVAKLSKSRQVLLSESVYNYPLIGIYGPSTVMKTPEEPKSVALHYTYGRLNLYPAVYPNIQPYPPRDNVSLKVASVLLPESQCRYPALGIYGPAPVSKPREEPRSVALPSTYGRLNLYPSVYPNIQPYPPRDTVSLKAASVFLDQSEYKYPVIGIYAPVSKSKTVQKKAEKIMSVRLASSYGRLNLYPAVYPNIQPYPPRDTVSLKAASVFLDQSEYKYPVIGIYAPVSKSKTVQKKAEKFMSVRLASSYGRLNLYPAVYPNIQPYPPRDNVTLKIASVLLPQSECKYPALGIYGPAAKPKEALKPVNVHLPSSYGRLNLYPAHYPNIQVYPARDSVSLKAAPVLLPESTSKYPVLSIYGPARVTKTLAKTPAKTATKSRLEEISVRLPSKYGRLNLYPAVYPHIEPYPAKDNVSLKMVTVLLPQSECVYPKIGIYARVPEKPLPVSLSRSYGRLNLYPSVYPHLEIYPAVDAVKVKSQSVSLQQASYQYPNIVVYPAVRDAPLGPVNVKLSRSLGYPSFEIYESVYPIIRPYPRVGLAKPMRMELPRLQSVKITSSRVTRYPYVEPYTPIPRLRSPVDVHLHASYPAFNLYPAVYPKLEIYPESKPQGTCSVVSTLLPGGSQYPTFLIYPNVAGAPVVLPVPARIVEQQRKTAAAPRRPTKTHAQLHTEVFSRQITEPRPRPAPIATKRPGKTHAQLHVEVFGRQEAERTKPNVLSALTSNRPAALRKKSHNDLHGEVFPEGYTFPEDIALASPVPELPTITPTTRVGRARAPSVSVSTITAGLHSRSGSLRGSQAVSPVPSVSPVGRSGSLRGSQAASPVPSVSPVGRSGSLRGSQAVPPVPPVPTVSPVVGTRVRTQPTGSDSPSRVKRLSASFSSSTLSSSSHSSSSHSSSSLSSGRPLERRPSTKENEPVPTRSRTNSIAHRAQMLLHQDEKPHEPVSSGARLTRTPSKLDKSKYPFA